MRTSTVLVRIVAGAAAATLLVLSLPSPAAAAPTPSVSISDVTVTESTGAPATASFTIQVAPPPRACCSLQVSWSTAPGSATAPGDFSASSGTVTLSRGATSRVISIPIVGDATDEPTETLVVNLTSLVGSPGQIGDAQGVGTITDNDLPPTLSVNDVSLAEGNAGTTTATFTVSLSAASAKTVTVDWATASGTATGGTDFVSTSGSRTIAAGATTATITITVNGDTLDEVDETFSVTLSNPANATIADASGLGTITDDDPAPALSIGDVSLAEGNAGTTTATFTVSLSAASAKTVTVDWATVDGDAVQPVDYSARSGTVTFVPGDTSETIGVSVNGDLVAELDEAFRVVLAAPTDATLADSTGVGTLEDDELLPVIDIDEPTATEGAGTISFTVSLSNPSAAPVTVDWTTAPGTGAEGADYLADSGTVTFASLDTDEVVTIVVNDDSVYEGDETMSLDLSNATNAPIGDPRGIGTITNDEAAPGVAVGNASVTEGNTGQKTLTFAVTLTGDTEVDGSVAFVTTGVTAVAGTDYEDTTGTLMIPAGETAATVDVVVHGDVAYEAAETLSLVLNNPDDVQVLDGSAVGTITNDDKAPTAVTVRVARTPTTVSTKGVMERAKSGLRLTATLFRSLGDGRFVKIATTTVRIRDLRDRDRDGKKDGSYAASFLRPKAGGTYKVVVSFKGTATFKPCSRSKLFTLAAT